jgi:hypothetical protein
MGHSLGSHRSPILSRAAHILLAGSLRGPLSLAAAAAVAALAAPAALAALAAVDRRIGLSSRNRPLQPGCCLSSDIRRVKRRWIEADRRRRGSELAVLAAWILRGLAALEAPRAELIHGSVALNTKGHDLHHSREPLNYSLPPGKSLYPSAWAEWVSRFLTAGHFRAAGKSL